MDICERTEEICRMILFSCLSCIRSSWLSSSRFRCTYRRHSSFRRPRCFSLLPNATSPIAGVAPPHLDRLHELATPSCARGSQRISDLSPLAHDIPVSSGRAVDPPNRVHGASPARVAVASALLWNFSIHRVATYRIDAMIL